MTETFLEHFESITDPRIERCKKHNLLRKYRLFEAGIPKHDTIARVICRLKPDEIEQAFQSWISSFVKNTGCNNGLAYIVSSK